MTCLDEEEILEYLYSLPENEDDSEEECDEDTAEELTRLEVTNSGCNERDGSFAVAVDISQEGTEPDHQGSDTSEDENEWSDSVSYFEGITRAKPSHKPSQSVNSGSETCAKRKSTSPCLLAIPAFDRIAGLSNKFLNSNRGICER